MIKKLKKKPIPYEQRKWKFLGGLTISEYNKKMFENVLLDESKEPYANQTSVTIKNQGFELDPVTRPVEKQELKYCVIGPRVTNRSFGGERTWFIEPGKAESHAKNLLQKNINDNINGRILYVVKIVRVVRVKDPSFETCEVI